MRLYIRRPVFALPIFLFFIQPTILRVLLSLKEKGIFKSYREKDEVAPHSEIHFRRIMNQGLLVKDITRFQDVLMSCSEMICPGSKSWLKRPRIAIVQIVEEDILRQAYGHAIMSVACYARAQNYEHFILVDQMFFAKCLHKNKFFLKHCIVAYVLRNYDYVLFLGNNIGVVNPKRRIEEYIDENADLIFLENIENWEIATGTYLVKRSSRSLHFLNGLADYEGRVPPKLHEKHSVIIHEYLAEYFPLANLSACHRIREDHSSTEHDLLYQACIRHMLNPYNQYWISTIKILPKATGWARDSWTTNSKWARERDFMMGYGNDSDMIPIPKASVPLISVPKATWYSPLNGRIEICNCIRGNTTWHYNPHLIADRHEIDSQLNVLIRQSMKNYAQAFKLIKAVSKLDSP